MESPTLTSCSSLKDVVDHILVSRKITRQDQRLLLTLTTNNAEEMGLIRVVFDRLRQGLLRVVD
ncbi:MAG TPA: hypothetical protein IGS53_27215 [Leptolyngbyaceae cyanobacterium M33_DOE_097]|uniref:Uncharacterized protein n=1 Tax=Oscillatoriales cyanobacterium SpSt-418 TaxID=2282169 RepID=A0A7C3KGS0_9CYAN|nr:hypothetical protein [Leptolyngbyaceae cyanobacterium M33_DOE_097]